MQVKRQSLGKGIVARHKAVGVTAVVAIAVTGMWALENAKFGGGEEEKSKKRERRKKASEMKAKKTSSRDAAAQRQAPSPPVQATKSSAPPDYISKGKKGNAESKHAAEETTVCAPAAQPMGGQSKAGKKKKAAAAAAQDASAPMAQPPPPAAQSVKKEKKKKGAALSNDADEGWCQVGKGGKPKEKKTSSNVAGVQLTTTQASPGEAFFQVPVGAGGDFLQAIVTPNMPTSGPVPVATVGSAEPAFKTAGNKKKENKKPDPDHSSNGWSPAADEVANMISRDFAAMTIAPAPVKKVVADGDEWATVPVKSKKRSAKP